MLTDKDIERRCRYRLARHGLRFHKQKDGGYLVYDIKDPEKTKWYHLNGLISFCETLAEKEHASGEWPLKW